MLLVMRHFPAGAEGQAYWVHLDGRGSVAGITKHQGQSTHNYRYDAYGQVLPAQGNWTDPHNHYTFLGKEWDEHLGLYEFGVRLYDPWAGVWLTREPLPGDAWEPRTWQRYQYAFANPITYYDPYGMQAPPPVTPVPAPTPPPYTPAPRPTPTPGPSPTPTPGPSPTPTLTPAPQPRPTPPRTPTPTPTGASQCVQPLSSELWLYARQAATEFGLPPEFVAAVLWAQQKYDYSWYQDAVEDALARTALVLIEAQELNLRLGWPSQDAGWQGWLILAVIERLDLSLGVGQLRLSTARGVAEEFYGISPSTHELVGQLENPEWNVRYMAGYLRQLANERGTEEFTIAEMQILYGAYREGTRYGALQRSEPGPKGSLLSPEIIRNYLLLCQS